MKKRLSNPEVVVQLKEALAAMEIKGENKFGIRAYQNAIASIDSLTSSVYDLWENNRLTEIAGVGPSLKSHLKELFRTGAVKEWERKKKDLPQGMFELLVLRGVGAKTAFKLAKEFNVNKRENALDIIKNAAEGKKIQVLTGFGEKSERDILDSLNELKMSKGEKPRLLLYHAEEISDRIIAHLKKLKHVKEVKALGSLRRRKATVGDIDFAVSSPKPREVIDHFVKFSEIKDIETQGEDMSTVILGNDVQVDILVCPPKEYGSLLQHFTGSKQHNIALRTFSLDQNKSLSQHGIKSDGKLHKFDSEEAFYKDLGLPLIPPELREGKDEIEAAKKGYLPKLVKLSDIKGDLHVHTTDSSDGKSSLSEMIEAAKAQGYEYLGISDHAPSVTSRGRYEVLGIVEKKMRAIAEINEKNPDFKVLFGYEVNILKDATLGMPDEILEKLDYVVAGIHTSHNQSREQITKRLLAAIENPLVTIIAHPSGRLINERAASEVDWEVLFKACKKHNKILEINAYPTRLDLADHLVKDAIKRGIRIVINSDAHEASELSLMKYGVDVARRGWCEKKDIVNTLSFQKLVKDVLHR